MSECCVFLSPCLYLKFGCDVCRLERAFNDEGAQCSKRPTKTAEQFEVEGKDTAREVHVAMMESYMSNPDLFAKTSKKFRKVCGCKVGSSQRMSWRSAIW